MWMMVLNIKQRTLKKTLIVISHPVFQSLFAKITPSGAMKLQYRVSGLLS